METALNYFAVFGGLDVKLDLNKPLGSLIKRHILDLYYELYDELSKVVKTDNIGNKILSGAALGDRRVNSAFKRAECEFDVGIQYVYELEEFGVITQETSMDFLTNKFEENDSADRLLFASPFLRFWYAFVSPLYRGVKREEYDEVYKRFENRKNEFMDLIFESLCHEYIQQTFKEDSIEEMGRYWDKKSEINLLAQTESGKVIVGACKYTNSKLKSATLNELKSQCEKLEIVPDYVVIFSKSGYTNEFKSLKGNGLSLHTVKTLKGLLR